MKESIMASELFAAHSLSQISPVNQDAIRPTLAPNTQTIQSLKEIQPLTPAGGKKHAYFDIDETLFCHNPNGSFGSKRWRDQFKKEALTLLTHDTELSEKLPPLVSINTAVQKMHDHLTYSLATNIPTTLVESDTVEIINTLKEQGFTPIGFTSRQRGIWYRTHTPNIDELTSAQLNRVGIDFSNFANDPNSTLATLSDQAYGILFSSRESKSEYYEKEVVPLFEKEGYPVETIFVDDKKLYADTLAEIFGKHGIPHTTFNYTAVDAFEFDPHLANIGLYFHLQSPQAPLLTNEEARAIAAQHPDRDSAWYLKSAVEMTLTQLYSP